MKLDGNFEKRKITELKSEINQRRIYIEKYITRYYGMNPALAQYVSDLFTKSSLINVEDLYRGKYDDAIQEVVEKITQQNDSSLNDAKYIRETEKKEPLYPQDPSIYQSERRKQLAMEAYNRRKKYAAESEKYRQMLLEEQKQFNELDTEITSKK